MKLREIDEYIKEAAPFENALEYDNIGLLAGEAGMDVKRIMTALDVNIDVLEEAKDKNCDMILAHHPVMFGGVEKITDQTEEGRALLYAIKNNIGIYAAHTNLDFARGGLNDFFLKKLGFEAAGAIYGNEGRYADTAIEIEELLARIAAVFETGVIRTNLGDGKITRIAVCTGSGKSLIDYITGAQCYITGELGHHDIQRLGDRGCGYVEMSHYDSEKIVKELLKNMLEERFKGKIEVIMSENERDMMRTVILK